MKSKLIILAIALAVIGCCTMKLSNGKIKGGYCYIKKAF